jgi:Amt family ammonium transporter
VTEGGLWHEQIKAIVVTLLLAVGATFLLAQIVKVIVGLRPIPEIERQGLDLTEHGEEGYID